MPRPAVHIHKSAFSPVNVPTLDTKRLDPGQSAVRIHADRGIGNDSKTQSPQIRRTFRSHEITKPYASDADQVPAVLSRAVVEPLSTPYATQLHLEV